MGTRLLLIIGLLICIAAFLLVGASCQSWQFVDIIPPPNLTETRLIVTYGRIETYWNEHGRVPTKPDELPDVKGRDCSMKDGWGRELHWVSDGASRVTVRSFGRDGKPGGTGEDADLEIVFVGIQNEQHEFIKIRRNDVPQ
jgi:hypothetical protein